MRAISLSQRWLSSFVDVAGLGFLGMNTSYAITLVDSFDTPGVDQEVFSNDPADGWVAQQFTGATAVGGFRDLLVRERPNTGIASGGISLIAGASGHGFGITAVSEDTDVTGLSEIQWDGDDAADPVASLSHSSVAGEV